MTIKLNTVHIWTHLPLDALARHDRVILTETMPVTPQDIRALNPTAQVYRYYSLLARPISDTLAERQFPIPLETIDGANLWLYDGNGERMEDRIPGVFFLDAGNPGLAEAWLSEALPRLAGFDGVVLDYCQYRLSWRIAGRPYPVQYPDDAAWFEAYKPYFSRVCQGLQAAGLRVVASDVCIGPAYADPYGLWHRPQVDALIYEALALRWDGAYWTESQLAQRIAALQDDSMEVWTSDRVVDDQGAMLSLACFYIGSPGNVPRYYHHKPLPGTDYAPFWESEWNIDLGQPTAKAEQITPFRWRRYYQGGLVLLNYGPESWTYRFSKPWRAQDGALYRGRVPIPGRTGLVLKKGG